MKLTAKVLTLAASGLLLGSGAPLVADSHTAPDPVDIVEAQEDRTARVAQQLWDLVELGIWKPARRA